MVTLQIESASQNINVEAWTAVGTRTHADGRAEQCTHVETDRWVPTEVREHLGVRKIFQEFRGKISVMVYFLPS
jgi:hypothetical protein